MQHRVKFFPLALGIASVLSLLLLIFPLSTQTSSFSLSLDLDNSEGDQAISSLDVFPNRTLFPSKSSAQILRLQAISPCALNSIPRTLLTTDLSEQTSYRAPLPLHGKNFANIGITLSAGNPISGLIGTIRFRTTEAFSGTDIHLVRARLVREGQTETVLMDLSITLQACETAFSRL